MNSREKGKRGERQWRDELRANGYDARRGQQFSGSPDSPDVICEALPWAHFEVKAVERLNLEDAMEQARRDAGRKVPFVAHKRNFRPFLVTMTGETFFRLLRGEFPESGSTSSPAPLPSGCGEEDGARGAARPTQKISAAACAAANSENNQPEKEQTHEDPS